MSIVQHPLPITEGKVYKTKKNKNKQLSDEEAAIKELETILSVKNRRPCDCEGQEHELVANCLGCGRIVCCAEGSGNCLTCGNLVLNKDQKSRLQEHINLIPGTLNINHQSENGPKNVRVIDDQFNYFSMADQKWLTDNDRQALRQEMDELQAAKYRRKMMLHVDIDNMIGGAESMPEIGDFEERVKNLQLKSEQLPGGSSGTKETRSLRDIVESEAAKVLKFKYLSKEDRDESKKINQNQTKAKKARSTKSNKSKQPNNNISNSSSAAKKQLPSGLSKSGSKSNNNAKGTDSKVDIKKNRNEKIITPTRLPNAIKRNIPLKQPIPTSAVKNAWKENIRKDQVKKDNSGDTK